MSLLRDGVLHGLRFFRRDASVAFPAAGILALGLGANVAIFAVAYAVLLRPLPVEDQHSLVIMWERAEQQVTSVWEVSYRDFRDWESQNRSFTRLAAIGSINWPLRLIQKEGPVVLPFAAVSGTFFDVLGTRPALGRGLTSADDMRSSSTVVVLSDSVWRNRFRSDPGVIASVMIDDGGGASPMTIVGVMPPEFDYPRGAAFWLPIAPTLRRLSVAAGADMLEERDFGILYVLGRLRPGISLVQARADLDVVVHRTPVVTAFAVGASVLTVLACGVLPLVLVLRRMHALLPGRSDATGGTPVLRVRHALLVVQTALAVVLLVAAALTVRSFYAIQRVQLGFDPADLITFDLLAPPGKYEKHEANTRFYQEAIERVRRLPGISAAAGVYLRPFEFGAIGSGVAVVLEGDSPRDRDARRKNPTLNAEAVTPDYFNVMRIPVLQGRAFTEQVTDDAPPVIIVSLSAARRLWPGQNPIGKRLIASYDRPTGNWQTVVGVVGDVRYRGLKEATLDLYKPYLQFQPASF